MMRKRPNFLTIIANSPTIFIIGVAGDSGSGKTTFTRAIREIFGENLVSTISLDDYHTLDRCQREKAGITPLAPEANNISLLEDHVAALKRGEQILKPVYDHTRGTIEPPIPFTPTKIIILEGLHTLSTPALRHNLDFTLFVDPAPEVKTQWKILRDVERRGYQREEVIREIEVRKPDYEKYIAPQRRFADAIVAINLSRFAQPVPPERDIYQVTLLQEKEDRTIQNISLSFDLSAMCSLSDRNFLFEFMVTGTEGRRMGAITVDGEIRYDAIQTLESTIEHETGVHPIALFAAKEYVTASELIELILSWRIINRRIAIEETSGKRHFR